VISFTLALNTTNPLNCGQGFSKGATMVRARNRKTQRTAAYHHALARLNAWPLAKHPPWLVTLTRIAPSSGLDDDGLPPALKSIRDGIADALGLKSDRDPRISWRYAQRRGPPALYSIDVRIETRTQDHNVSRGCAEGVENS